MRSHLSRMPATGYPRYDDSSLEFAFVIPLWISPTIYKWDRSPSDVRCWVHGAIGVGTSLYQNTNVVEHKIPIFYYIDYEIWDKWQSTFLNAGINPDRLLPFAKMRTQVKERQIASRLEILNDERLSKYRSYVVSDADLFTCCKPDIAEKIDITPLIGDKLGSLYFEPFYYTTSELITERPWNFAKWGIPTTDPDHLQKNFDISEAKLQSVYPHLSLKRTDIKYPTFSGGMIRFPNPAPEGMMDFCFPLIPYLGDDELIMMLYTAFNDVSVDSFPTVQPKIIFDWNEILEKREEGAYWGHPVSYSIQMEDWELAFQRDIGITDGRYSFIETPEIDIHKLQKEEAERIH